MEILFPVWGIPFPVMAPYRVFFPVLGRIFRFRKEIFRFRLVLARDGEGGPGALDTYLPPSVLNSAPHFKYENILF